MPLHVIPAVKAYTNKHGITFSNPEIWHIEDATLNYEDLEAAAMEGGAFMSKNRENLGYRQVLGALLRGAIWRARRKLP